MRLEVKRPDIHFTSEKGEEFVLLLGKKGKGHARLAEMTLGEGGGSGGSPCIFHAEVCPGTKKRKTVLMKDVQ